MSRIGDSEVREFLKKQTLVKYWIEEVLKVRLGDDLIQSLKNGIVLCYLMAEIEPLSIPKIQEATKAPFRLQENVQFFLEACNELGMKREERFLLGDLWGSDNNNNNNNNNNGSGRNTTNVVRVVLCIVSLSRIAASRGFTPAMRDISTLPDTRILVPEGEMLNELKEMLSRAGSLSSNNRADGVKLPVMSPDLMRKKLAYLGADFTNRIVVSQCEAGIIKFQALYRGYTARKNFKKRVRDLAYRERVAREILKTEKDYVENLDVLIKVFYLPLEELANNKKPVLTKEQIKGIFADIQTIFNFNESLLKRLEERVENWSTHQKLGDIFVEIVSFMKVYTNYVQNFNTSLALLSSAGKKPAVAKFLKECSENPKCTLDLSAYLIMPVQRIPRYHLLLQDLVKHTWKEHCDYEHLSEAMDKVKQIGTLLNEKKREAETMAETFERHGYIKGKEINVTPDRRFIRQDIFIDVKKGLETTVYLFNDIIVYGKPQGAMISGKSKIKYVGQYSTSNCDVCEKPDAKTFKWCFSIGDTLLAAKSEEERAVFIEAVNQVKAVATEKLSSHLKDSNSTPAPTDTTSAEDTLRMRKMNQKLDSASTPSTITRSPSDKSQSSPSGEDTNDKKRNSDDTKTKPSESPNVEKETLMKSKHTILQQLLDLPVYGSKQDTKKVQKKRTQLQEELEAILRKLSSMDQLVNSPPIVVNTNDFDDTPVPSTSNRSSTPSTPSTSRSPSNTSGVIPTSEGSQSPSPASSPAHSPIPSPAPSRPSRPGKPPVPPKKGNTKNDNTNTIAVPMSSVRDSGGFNSVRGYKPKAYQASPFTRSNSNPNLLATSTSSSVSSSGSVSPTGSPASFDSKHDSTNISEGYKPEESNNSRPLSAPTEAASPPSPTTDTPLPPREQPSSPVNETPSTLTDTKPTPAVPPRLVPKGPAKFKPAAGNSSTELNSKPDKSDSTSPVPNTSRPTSPTLNPRPASPALKPVSPGVSRVSPPVPPKPSPRAGTTSPTSPNTRPTSPAPTLVARPTSPVSRPTSVAPTLARQGSVIIKPSGPAPPAPSRQAGNLSLEEVLQQKASLEILKLETYLSEADFTEVFKMSREAFYKQPKWKQDLLKKEHKLN